MRFEARDLKSYAEPVPTDELKIGTIYFAVNFLDRELLVPAVQPMVFIGFNLDPENTDRFHFQDVGSYQDGVRYGSAEEGQAMFETGTERHIFEFEKALDVLMVCALRRRKNAGQD